MRQSFLYKGMSICWASLFLLSATAQRARLSFDYGWERYRITPSADTTGSAAFHRGVSFQSQFNDEHVDGQARPVYMEKEEAVQGFAREYPAIRDSAWEAVTLPCSARDETELNPGARQFQGICYYRKTFRIPDSLLARELSLYFEGAMQVATVWVNGVFITQHQGGYLPFTVPLSHLGKTNEIIVRVDNRDNRETPPGKPLARLGFLYWSGIYRDVWLDAVNAVHITDAFARYEDVSACSARILIQTQVSDSSRAVEIRQTLIDRQGRVAGRSRSGEIRLAHPHLWSPDAPYLYRLVTEVWVDGRRTDREERRIGVRSLSYTRGGGFKLNGQPLRIVGTNRHQDHPYIGNALSPQAQYRDLKRIKLSGMNFVRLAHYPQDPSVFDICDSLGLMVADPIPGWQFFNRDEVFTGRVMRDIRQTVRRDRNHPCVIMWEMSLNESYPPDSFRIASARAAHEEYPGDQFFTSGDTYGSKKTAWDIPYNSWEDPMSRPQEVQPADPGFVREYGHYEFGGENSTTNSSRARGEKTFLFNAWNIQWEHNLLRGPQYYPWTVGDANWAFFDGFEAYTKGTTDWGVMDVFRIPKFSYYFFKSQADPHPMVYIANWWTPEDTTGKVVVYGNTERVALYLNGKLLTEKGPDDGPDSPYGDWDNGGNPFDGGNAWHLDHPPFTFTHIPFTEGTLEAVGYSKGKKVATCIVRTPSIPARIVLQADTMGMSLTANGSDVVFVNASIVDAGGTIEVLDNQTEVKFSIQGPGEIVGPSTVRVRGGIATILVRAGTKPGAVVVQAEALPRAVVKSALRAGVVIIRSKLAQPFDRILSSK